MFNITQAILDGTEKTLVSFDTNTEGTIHSATLDNSSGSDITVTFGIGLVTWSYVATSNSKTSISERLNIPADTIVTVNGSSGVTVTCSYIEQAIDASSALNQAQQVIATLPEGTINDLSIAPDKTWSSSKISDELSSIDISSYTGDVDITGKLTVDSYNESYVALSGTTPTIDCESGNVFALSTTGNTTFTFSNPPASGTAYGFTLKLTAGGTHTITYPSSVDWAAATAPDAPASGETNVLVFITHDGGATWYGFQAGGAMG